MEKLTVKFNYERETKNCFRYDKIEEYDVPIVGALYVRKCFLDQKPAPKLVVTIEANGEN